jgi:signal transduction histidine kinase
MAERLEAHEGQRRRLLADVTHELRTPLAVIQGNLEGLLDGIYPRDDTHLAPILEEARVLAALIEDLRTLALAETGALALHRESTDLGTLITDTTLGFQPEADARGIALTTDCSADLPLLEVDPIRIRQVLVNLLTNALQHTPAGGTVLVACHAPSDGERPEVVSVTVSDNGHGIASEDLPRIFERFYKSRGSKGSGLGLAIAKNLVALHGGAIRADSELGKGTTVTFTLPLVRTS